MGERLRAVAWCVVAVLVASAAAHAGVGLRAGTALSATTWQTVALDRNYNSMVVVCTPNYSKDDPACVVRVRNAAGNSFEFMVQRADGSGAAVAGVTVHYLAVEEGVYTEAADGVKMEAVKYLSAVTDNATSWSGEIRTYQQSYTQPVVLGQVMTANDAAWSVFWCAGSARNTPPNATLRVGKHVGEDPNRTRADEVVGYIVIEAGSGTIDGRGYAAGLGADTLRGMDNTPPYTYSLSGISSAAVAIATQAAMDGGNGGWAVLYGANPLSASALALAIDEDQAKDTERKHTTEQAGYLVLESPPSPQLAIADVSIVEPGATVERYAKTELLVTLTGGSWSKPYDPDPANGGLDLQATFSGPSGTVTIPGFYDGTDWRVRFAPGEPGNWTFSVSAQDASVAQPVVWTGGSFTCVDNGLYKGWPRIDGHIIRYANGEAVFAVGHNNGWQWDVEDPPLADMAARGENLLSFWLAQPWAEMSWGAARAPIENAELGIGNYNQDACSYIDGVVARAEAAGVCLLPTIWSHDQLCDQLSWGAPSWWQNAYNALCSASDFYLMTDSGGDETPQWSYQKNFYRYLVARWGYSRAIAGWVGVCEVDGTDGYRTTWGGGPERVNAWVSAVRDFFAALDPFRANDAGQYPIVFTKTDTYPTSTSNDWNDWTGTFDLRAADSYRSARDDIGVAKTIADETSADPDANMYSSGKPCFHAEWGGDTTNGATQPTHLHNGLWAGAAAGAALSPLLWCDGGGWPMLSDPNVGEAMRAQLESLAQFMNSIDYLGDPALAPAAVSVSGNCRGWGMKTADRGYAWLQNPAGSIDGQSVSVAGLPPGTYTVEWYDAWTENLAPDATTVVPVGADGTLTATVPAIGRADVALKFFPGGPPNNPPVAYDQDVTTDEDTPVPITLTATDPDGDPLTYSVVTGPSHGSLSGTPPDLTYTPDPDYNGSDSFTFKANDGRADSNIATVSITIGPVNDPPVANDDQATTEEDTPVVIAVLANDTDPDGDPLVVLDLGTPADGGVVLNPDQTVTYTPNPGFTGSDSFTYTADDGHGGFDLAIVSVAVTRVNQPPVADEQDVVSDEDTPVAITLTATDPDGDPLTYSVVTGPSHGSLSGTLPDLTYTPDPDYNGPDNFTFKANDGQADSNVATVSITVNPVNDAPVAANDAYDVDQDGILNVAAPGVLGNDSDIDGDDLSAVLATGPSNGQLALNPDGSFTYSPNQGFSGADSFTYRASDGSAQSAPATVTITVKPSAPTAVIAIDMSVRAFWKWWRCTATVTVKDQSGAPIAGATVEGHWGAVYSGNVSGSTDNGGAESWRTGWITTSGTLTFTVDRVSKDGQDYLLSGETSDQVTH